MPFFDIRAGGGGAFDKTARSADRYRGKGKREKTDFVVTACEVGGQLSAQQIGIAACEDQMEPLTQQPVDEQMPTGYVLYLVHKQMGK